MELLIVILVLVLVIPTFFYIMELRDIIDSKETVIDRMYVGQKNQKDREKQLLERIKFLEANQK